MSPIVHVIWTTSDIALEKDKIVGKGQHFYSLKDTHEKHKTQSKSGNAKQLYNKDRNIYTNIQCDYLD